MVKVCLDSIGIYRSDPVNKYELSRQPVDTNPSLGRILLHPKMNFEQALEGLCHFDRIWIVFLFDQSLGWKPKVSPPRWPGKIGVFATRSPHRPVPVGMSCVQLKEISGRSLYVQGADLLDKTTILDLKPYIPYCDSFPDAKAGWVDTVHNSAFTLKWSDLALKQKAFLRSLGVHFSDHVFDLLKYFTGPNHYNRIKHIQDDLFELAYKSFRISFLMSKQNKLIIILSIHSGYPIESLQKLQNIDEKNIHLALFLQFN